MANNRIADQKRLNEVDIISFKKESESKVGAVIQLCQVGSFYPSTLPTLPTHTTEPDSECSLKNGK